MSLIGREGDTLEGERVEGVERAVVAIFSPILFYLACREEGREGGGEGEFQASVMNDKAELLNC